MDITASAIALRKQIQKIDQKLHDRSANLFSKK